MNPRYLPLVGFIALALGLWAAMEYNPDHSVPAQSHLPTLTLLAEDGKEVRWQPTAGKVTMVNFFASWCMPCLAEHPQLKQLSKIEDIELHGIAWNDSAPRVQSWLKKNGNPFNHVWMDHTGRAAIAVGLRGIPESYVIDKTGKVRLHIRGALTPNRSADLAKLLHQLRTEKTDAPAS